MHVIGEKGFLKSGTCRVGAQEEANFAQFYRLSEVAGLINIDHFARIFGFL